MIHQVQAHQNTSTSIIHDTTWLEIGTVLYEYRMEGKFQGGLTFAFFHGSQKNPWTLNPEIMGVL